MPENRQNHNNVALNNIQEGILRMKIEKKEEGEEYPNRPGEPDCIYYLRTGRCGYATNCRFNHPPLPPPQTDEGESELPQRDGQPDCGHFLKTGTCKYGSMCKYHHPLDRRGAEDVPLNSLGLPLREQEKPCPFYLRTQKCKYGAACKFDHPQPTSVVETALPVSGAIAVGIGSSLPSTGIPYVGGAAVPAWPWSRTSRVPGPPAYMPYIIPPLQGPVAAQNWNGYLGNMSSMAASAVVGTDLVYNPMNSGEQADLSTMTVSNLPERPDQPECRYFMSTGGCKYGSNCKFHHPKGRIAHSLGPHGLPLRPGEDICGHFSSYGICKYGSTCKFNHPIAGYISSYYYGMPSIPYLNQPFFATPRNLAVPNSTETSQSKSSKITDWIQKPETVEGKNRQHSVTKPIEVPNEKSDDQSVSVSVATDEIPRDQSD
ncbi:hypothetical protein RND81_11G085300 [Saponaria officinalis]|uniref:C3H1-type domain-containing protein n=1 Tax=Saponaria officinalis TaxID=3572 RepID=A0AAW1HJT3_SAPOF